MSEKPKNLPTATTGTAIAIIENSAEGKERDPFEEATDPNYEPWMCDMVELWAGEMMFPEEWAMELEVSERVMHRWLKHPDFARAYTRALTKLRAVYTRGLVGVARGQNFPECPNPPNAAAWMMIGKMRFRDLYGDNPPMLPPDPESVRDITPGRAQFAGWSAEELRARLQKLRDEQEG